MADIQDILNGTANERLFPYAHTMTIWDYLEIFASHDNPRSHGANTIRLPNGGLNLWSDADDRRIARESRRVITRDGQESFRCFGPTWNRITPEMRDEIYGDPRRYNEIALTYGIHPRTVRRIKGQPQQGQRSTTRMDTVIWEPR